MTDFTDDFTGTSGQNLEARTGWTRVDGVAGAAQIDASNQLKVASTTDTAYTAPAPGASLYHAEASVASSSTSAFGPCVRLQDRNNFIGFRFTGSREIYKRIGGTFTLLFSSTGGVVGDVYRLETDNSTGDINLYRNGVAFSNPVANTTDLNTVQASGVVPRNATLDPWLDSWASTQAAAGGGTTVVPPGLLMANRAVI